MTFHLFGRPADYVELNITFIQLSDFDFFTAKRCSLEGNMSFVLALRGLCSRRLRRSRVF